MSPGIGLMKRRVPTEKEAIPLAVSGIVKKYSVSSEHVKTLETKFDEDGEIGMLPWDLVKKRQL